MKIRAGFVSNSSSSSFIIRGVSVNGDVLSELLGISKDDLYYHKIADLECRAYTNYFDDADRKKFTDFIIGKEWGSCADDGDVVEVVDDIERDKGILESLNKLGIPVTKLSTFFQYISNDNY